MGWRKDKDEKTPGDQELEEKLRPLRETVESELTRDWESITAEHLHREGESR